MSLKVDINITNPAAARKLGSAEKALGKKLIKVAVNKALEKAARQATVKLAAATIAAPPAKPGNNNGKGAVASGEFLKAWEIIPDRPTLSIAILNKKIYAPYVDGGVPAGATGIPRSALVLDLFEKWIRDRKIIPRRPGMSHRQLAKLIIWKINKRPGIRFQPRNIVNSSTPRIQEIFRARLSEELTRAIVVASGEK